VSGYVDSGTSYEIMPQFIVSTMPGGRCRRTTVRTADSGRRPVGGSSSEVRLTVVASDLIAPLCQRAGA
jgi:hypothetical protein